MPVTGRDEEFVLWFLPYARGLSYLHAVAVANGTEMELVNGGNFEDVKGEMRDQFMGMRKRFQEAGK